MTRPTRRSSRLAATLAEANTITEPAEPDANAHTAQVHEFAEDPASALQSCVSNVVQAAKALNRDYRKLKQRNEELSGELADAKEQLESDVQPKRGHKGKGPNVPQLQKQILALKARVRGLEKTKIRDRREIAKLQAKEVKRDAEELQDQTKFEVGDSVHMMRKLLRKFHDLMLANSLENEEECSICMMAMEVGKASSLPCQHVFCNDCIRHLASHTANKEGVFKCPSCRESTTLEDADVVEYTSSMQWDALLEVAKASAELDRRRGELDTSDEEAEEAADNFISDDSEDAASTVPDPEPKPEEEASISSPPLDGSPAGSIHGVPRITTPSEHDDTAQNGAGSSTDSTLTNLDEAEGGGEEAPDLNDPLPSTPRPALLATPSYLQSPASEKRRRLAQLADARQEKEKRRRFG